MSLEWQPPLEARGRRPDGPARGPDARRDVRWARGLGHALVEELRKGAEWRANKLTASEYDETTWSARTWTAFTTQRLSVAVQYSAAQEVAEARGLSMAANHERRPRWAGAGLDAGGILAAWVSSQGRRPGTRLLCRALRL